MTLIRCGRVLLQPHLHPSSQRSCYTSSVSQLLPLPAASQLASCPCAARCLLLQAYGDAYLTAHFEVPGEMFRLAMQAKARGMGVVGSTSNILDFIAGKLQEAMAQDYGQRLTFVLGTEAGMITSIVRKVQALLGAAGRSDVEVEVVFPVNPRSITTSQQQVAGGGGLGQAGAAGGRDLAGLQVVPGPAGGEGCSLEGGCASCPYMKMNSLAALMTVARGVGDAAGEALLEGFQPRAYTDRVGGKSIAQAGCEPILHMRYFTQHKRFSPELVADILSRNA